MTQPMTDQQLADHLRTLDLIQEERDHQPQFFKANYEMHAPRLLEIAQSLRAELEQTRQHIADIRAYCPEHGTAETCRIQCHCAIADELAAAAEVTR